MVICAEDHASSPFFYLPAEGVLNFAWYSPPSFRSATENVPCLASAPSRGGLSTMGPIRNHQETS